MSGKKIFDCISTGFELLNMTDSIIKNLNTQFHLDFAISLVSTENYCDINWTSWVDVEYRRSISFKQKVL